MPAYDLYSLGEGGKPHPGRQNINIIQDIEGQRTQHRSTKISVLLGVERQVSKEAIEFLRG
jgi:hypothetical protein